MATYRKYVDKKFNVETAAVIQHANDIIEGYESKGFSLTLRQLFYQFVVRGLISNTEASYDRLGRIVSDGRLAGLISWTAIEDRTRNLQGLQHFDNPSHLLKAALASYRIDMWANQRYRPEVWVEKEALVGVIGGICNKLKIDFFACKGYNSQSEQWRAARRLRDYVTRGQNAIVFHLGDHDPSGIDMTRDNQERLSMFAGINIPVVRIALNMDQIQKYAPPPNPAKLSDSRAESYIKKFGYESWELDALDPQIIHNLIESNVMQLRDQTAWDEMEAQQSEDTRRLEMMMEELNDDQDDV